jgi:hypothetical protein
VQTPERLLVVPAGHEKDMLLLLLSSDQWRSRVLEAREADDFEFPPYRAVFEAAELNAPDRLDEIAARTFESLKAEGIGERSADEMFQNASDRFDAKRLDQDVKEMRQMIMLAREEEKVPILVEFQRPVARRNERPTYHRA